MLRRKQKAPRKRTGCLRCKESHIKCTEEKPICFRCRRLGLSCEYGFKLLWDDDPARQNILHGRSGALSKDGIRLGFSPEWKAISRDDFHSIPIKPMRQGWKFLNLSVDDVRNGNHYDDLVCDTEIEGSNAGFIYPEAEAETNDEDSNEDDPIRSFPELFIEDKEVEEINIDLYHSDPPLQLAISQRRYSGIDSYLLDYYIQKVCPQCSLSADLNPYLSIMLPVAYNFTPLRDLLLSTAACQLRLWNDNRFSTQAISLKNRALRGLRQHLATMPADWTSLLTILMFCFHDVLDNCAASWTTHLAMGMNMFDRLAKGRAPTDDRIESFCELWLVVHDVMRSTTWQYGRSRKQLSWSKKDPLEIDPLVGCSRALITIIDEISSLAARCALDDELTPDVIAEERSHLMHQLLELQQVTPPKVSEVDDLVQSAEVKRLAAMLYLRQRIPNPMPADSTDEEAESQSLITSIIVATSRLSSSNATSMWPLFVLGNANLIHQSQRNFVLNKLAQLENSRKTGSLAVIRRILEAGMLSGAQGSYDHASSRISPSVNRLTDIEGCISLA